MSSISISYILLEHQYFLIIELPNVNLFDNKMYYNYYIILYYELIQGLELSLYKYRQRRKVKSISLI